MPFWIVALAVATSGLASLDASAEAADTRRVAVLLGNNQGAAGRAALKYAEEDVSKVAEVLTEIGGFAPSDIHLLRGASLAAVRATFATVGRRIASSRAGGARTVVLFYFSGHSDGEGLELGHDRWSFANVRASLKDLGPDIRIAIVDSCQSGALLAAKGGTPGPTFDIRFTDDLATTGEAILTSSAAHERALESKEIRASFFSHHFVSGLRGAADSSNDGRVTLAEAYRYAFVNTLLATSNTLAGPQHPAYDFRLSGQGELVLTEVQAHGSTLSLPTGFERILIADPARHYVLAELTATSAHRIALPAGRYVVQARGRSRSYETVVSLSQGQRIALSATDLGATGTRGAAAKGPDSAADAVIAAGTRDAEMPPSATRPFTSIGLAGLATRGAAEALPLVPGVQVTFERAKDAPRSFGAALTLQFSTGEAAGFRESAAYVGAGGSISGVYGGWRLAAGWRVSAGGVLQAIDRAGAGSESSETRWTLALGTGPSAMISRGLTRRMSVFLAAGVEARLMRGDVARGTLWPTGALGAAWRL